MTLRHGNVECYTNGFEKRFYNKRPPAIGTEHNSRRLMIAAGKLIDGQFSNHGKTRFPFLHKKLILEHNTRQMSGSVKATQRMNAITCARACAMRACNG